MVWGVEQLYGDVSLTLAFLFVSVSFSLCVELCSCTLIAAAW